MEKERHFIKETSNKYKIKIFLATVFILIIIIGSMVAFAGTLNTLFSKVPGYDSTKIIILEEVKSLSPIGLFYTGFAGGLFFIPIPQEAFFYYGLFNGNGIIVSLLTVNAGYLLAQGVNYFLGSKSNNFFIHLISKKNFYKARRFINRKGGFGIFIFNFLPLPAPLLTFALGVANYNIYRFFFYTLLGTTCKYAVIIALFILTN